MPHPETQLHVPNSEGQTFRNFVAEDEDIVFPGRPSSAGYTGGRSSRNLYDPLVDSHGHSSIPNELLESGLAYQDENKLHPFGLLWSELEGSHSRHAEPSDVPFVVGRSASLNDGDDSTSVAEKLRDVYRQDALSGPNSFKEAMSGRRPPRIGQEPNNFDLAEQHILRQFQQQQLEQPNLLSTHSRLNELMLQQIQAQNLYNQHLANHPSQDVEHLMALQLQQHQLQLQQQRQVQLQQQFQQKLLREQEEAQVQQALLERMLHGQMQDHGLHPQSRIDPVRANNAFDQLLFEKQFLDELQQQSHNPARPFVQSMEQLHQARFGQMQQQEQQRDLLELLQQQGPMASIEHQILLQEQLQARQMSMGLRQMTNIEDQRHVDHSWPRLAANLSHSSRMNSLDFHQRHHKAPREDQVNHLERNLSFQDRLRQGFFESGSSSFERSLFFPEGASGLNMDVVNAMAHGQGLDIPELSNHMQSASELRPFSSDVLPLLHPLAPNQFHVSPLDSREDRWSENNGHLANDLLNSRMQQLHINAERQKRELEIKMFTGDQSSWMSEGMNDDKSRQLLMELLHQRSSHGPADSVVIDEGVPFEKRVPSGLYSGSSSADHSLGVGLDQEANQTNSFTIGSYGSSQGDHPGVVGSVGGRSSNLESNETLPLRSESGAMFKEHTIFSSMADTAQSILLDSSTIKKSFVNKEDKEIEGGMQEPKAHDFTRVSASEIKDGMIGQMISAVIDPGEIPVNTLSRQSFLHVASSDAGFYDDKIGNKIPLSEDARNQVPSKGQENILFRRPPVPYTSPSLEGLSEIASDAITRGRSIVSSTDGGNSIKPGSEASALGRTDVRFQRSSSFGETGVSEPSFMDMLKSNVKKSPTTEAAESSDGTQGGRSGKKRGKKGRQIDPALLGFKVTSNRIMMGEIQGVDD